MWSLSGGWGSSSLPGMLRVLYRVLQSGDARPHCAPEAAEHGRAAAWGLAPQGLGSLEDGGLRYWRLMPQTYTNVPDGQNCL